MGMTRRSVATYRTKSKTLFGKDILHRYDRDQPTSSENRLPRDPSPGPKGPIKKHIDVIVRGPASSGYSSLA
ncbi:hypothetical protein BHM03_00053229 [Ensete ventricosum]|nr:hypothetical protein BHM03_00053229 [Ensete ventricosum]